MTEEVGVIVGLILVAREITVRVKSIVMKCCSIDCGGCARNWRTSVECRLTLFSQTFHYDRWLDIIQRMKLSLLALAELENESWRILEKYS